MMEVEGRHPAVEMLEVEDPRLEVMVEETAGTMEVRVDRPTPALLAPNFLLIPMMILGMVELGARTSQID